MILCPTSLVFTPMLCSFCGESCTGTRGVSEDTGVEGFEVAWGATPPCLSCWLAAGFEGRECHQNPTRMPTKTMLPASANIKPERYVLIAWFLPHGETTRLV